MDAKLESRPLTLEEKQTRVTTAERELDKASKLGKPLWAWRSAYAELLNARSSLRWHDA